MIVRYQSDIKINDKEGPTASFSDYNWQKELKVDVSVRF